MTSNFEKLTKGAQEHQYSYELTTPNQIQLTRDPYTKKIQKELLHYYESKDFKISLDWTAKTSESQDTLDIVSLDNQYKDCFLKHLQEKEQLKQVENIQSQVETFFKRLT